MREGKVPFDAEGWRQALDDGSVWLARAVVEVLEGEPSHFELFSEADGARGVMVSVELRPGGEPMWCLLGTGAGLWMIPPPGTPVLVGLEEGETRGEGVIVGGVASVAAPDGLGSAQAVLLLPAGVKLLIHDGTAAQAKELAFKDELEALWQFTVNQFDPATGHTHKAIVPAQLTNIVTSPVQTDVLPPLIPAQPVGTARLKAK